MLCFHLRSVLFQSFPSFSCLPIYYVRKLHKLSTTLSFSTLRTLGLGLLGPRSSSASFAKVLVNAAPGSQASKSLTTQGHSVPSMCQPACLHVPQPQLLCNLSACLPCSLSRTDAGSRGRKDYCTDPGTVNAFKQTWQVCLGHVCVRVCVCVCVLGAGRVGGYSWLC